ncbi:MAG TPA: NAD-dependent epimerase [Cytophagales bacterium]|jgi:NAD(P)-dependent dehydrogenase (short-subunit alcohol dehydrogenase family)|nr:NAD-dependent epimerase [Cytophagales bacterium]
MKTLIAGATGATGSLLTRSLLEAGQDVKVMVRSTDRLPEAIRNHKNLEIIEAAILDLPNEQLAGHLADCQAVASCLGHNLTMKGVFGPPRKLVTDAVRKLAEAIGQNKVTAPVKLVLMNTAGNRNRDLNEPLSFADQLIIGLIRLLVPPQSDNEQAAEVLRKDVGRNNPAVEWVVIRPDSLIDEEHVTEYTLHASPTQSAITNPGKTSRINVADCMARLILDNDLWEKWKGQMPVVYNVST